MNEIFEETREDISAGTFQVIVQPMTLKSGAVYKKNSLIAIDSVSKKGVLASDTQKDYFGILTQEIDATVADEIGDCMVTGEFHEDGIVVTTDHVIDSVVLRNRSIFIK